METAQKQESADSKQNKKKKHRNVLFRGTPIFLDGDDRLEYGGICFYNNNNTTVIIVLNFHGCNRSSVLHVTFPQEVNRTIRITSVRRVYKIRLWDPGEERVRYEVVTQ